jgi:hypothetical protein
LTGVAVSNRRATNFWFLDHAFSESRLDRHDRLLPEAGAPSEQCASFRCTISACGKIFVNAVRIAMNSANMRHHFGFRGGSARVCAAWSARSPGSNPGRRCP